MPGSRFDFLARPQTGPTCLPAGVCLVSLVVTPARCSQADAARAALPPYAARAAQPLTQNVKVSVPAAQIVEQIDVPATGDSATPPSPPTTP